VQPALIIVLCVVAAIVYGIVHDQITARVCVEYFTIGHPPVFDTDDPTLLGLGWGIIATWWVGLILGLAAVVAARVGKRPPRSAGSLMRPVAMLMGVSAVGASVAGGVGFAIGKWVVILAVPYDIDHLIPRNKWAAFQACAFAHTASYWTGFIGGIVVLIQVWRSRRFPSDRMSGIG
jgi:hypothetical protein